MLMLGEVDATDSCTMKDWHSGIKTSICQKIPADFQEKLNIGHADEMTVYFDMPQNYTAYDKDAK
jgi:hypothetical protein